MIATERFHREVRFRCMQGDFNIGTAFMKFLPEISGRDSGRIRECNLPLLLLRKTSTRGAR